MKNPTMKTNYALIDWYLSEEQCQCLLVDSIIKYNDYIDAIMSIARKIRSVTFKGVEENKIPEFYIKPKSRNYMEYLPEAVVVYDIFS